MQLQPENNIIFYLLLHFISYLLFLVSERQFIIIFNLKNIYNIQHQLILHLEYFLAGL